MGAAMHNLSEGYTKDAGEGKSIKRARGRPFKGHFHDEVCPTHSTEVIMAQGLDLLSIPHGFCPYLSTVPWDIVLKTNTGCS
jgi:hypothetical protein